MIDFSQGELESLFDAQFKRGALLHCRYDFDDGSQRNKFALILKSCDGQDKCFLLLPTSQIHKITTNRLYVGCYYLFNDAEVSAFVKPTAVLLKTIHSKKVSYFKRKFVAGDGSCTFCDTIASETMSRIDNLICASRHIPLNLKQEVLPPELLA